jgi:late competence protein required for DNA uptake (superfamily II DNA/RNA helicase)
MIRIRREDVQVFIFLQNKIIHTVSLLSIGVEVVHLDLLVLLDVDDRLFANVYGSLLIGRLNRKEKISSLYVK